MLPEFVFVESEIIDGEYVWTPPSDTSTFGKIGNQYMLTILMDNTILEAVSQMNRVPEIDSIDFRFEEGNSFFTDSFFAGFFAQLEKSIRAGWADSVSGIFPA